MFVKFNSDLHNLKKSYTNFSSQFSLQNVLLTITASTATESIQFDGRAVSLGTGTSLLHVPSSSAQNPTTPTDISLNVLRSPSSASENSSPAPSNQQTGTISPSTTDNKRSMSDGPDVKSITQLLQQSAQQILKSHLDMPPPPTSPSTAPSPRKRRRKREDPQSCHTNSEVSRQMALIR